MHTVDRVADVFCDLIFKWGTNFRLPMTERTLWMSFSVLWRIQWAIPRRHYLHDPTFRFFLNLTSETYSMPKVRQQIRNEKLPLSKTSFMSNHPLSIHEKKDVRNEGHLHERKDVHDINPKWRIIRNESYQCPRNKGSYEMEDISIYEINDYTKWKISVSTK